MGFVNKFRKYFLHGLWSRNQRFLILEDQKGCIRGCEEFKYLGVKIDKEGRKENHIKNWINEGRAVSAMINSVLWSRQITRKNKLLIYNSIVKNTVTYEAEKWKFNKHLESKLMTMEMDVLNTSARYLRLEKNIDLMLLEKR